MAKILTFVLMVHILNLVRSKPVPTGSCKETQAKQNLDLALYSGVWYEVYNNNYEIKIKCEQADIRVEGNEGGFTLLEQVFSTNAKINVSFKANFTPEYNTGEAQFKNNLKVHRNIKMTVHYAVIDTNYQNYAVLYQCVEGYQTFHGYKTWIATGGPSIMSRTPQLEEEYRSTVNEILVSNNLTPLSEMRQEPQDCGRINCSAEKECRAFDESNMIEAVRLGLV